MLFTFVKLDSDNWILDWRSSRVVFCFVISFTKRSPFAWRSVNAFIITDKPEPKCSLKQKRFIWRFYEERNLFALIIWPVNCKRFTISSERTLSMSKVTGWWTFVMISSPKTNVGDVVCYYTIIQTIIKHHVGIACRFFGKIKILIALQKHNTCCSYFFIQLPLYYCYQDDCKKHNLGRGIERKSRKCINLKWYLNNFCLFRIMHPIWNNFSFLWQFNFVCGKSQPQNFTRNNKE